MDKRKKFTFSEFWFEGNISNWNEFFGHLRTRKIKVLEIGAFEGASTTWILEELLEHPESAMIAIDTFRGNIEHQTPERSLSKLEKRFYENVEKTGRADRLTVIKSKSCDALVELNFEKAGPFDLIYIDASHLARDVLSDAILSWPLLALNGFLVFDDYAWDYYREPYNNPRLAVDAFLACYVQDMIILHRYYQAIVQKIVREDSFALANSARKL